MKQQDRPEPVQPAVQLPYTDLPNVQEVFADAFRLLHFDGYSVRIEFVVTRPYMTGHDQSANMQYPAARLVLSPMVVGSLHEQLGRLMAVFEQQGILKRVSPTPEQKQ